MSIKDLADYIIELKQLDWLGNGCPDDLAELIQQAKSEVGEEDALGQMVIAEGVHLFNKMCSLEQTFVEEMTPEQDQDLVQKAIASWADTQSPEQLRKVHSALSKLLQNK